MSDTTADLLFELFNDFFTQVMNEGELVDNLLELDLTFSQVRVLFTLAHRDEPLPINEVAEKLGLSMAAAGRNIDQLVRHGLVDRREDERDRRVKRVSLSAAGHAAATRHVEHRREQLRRFASLIPESDRSRLIEALKPVLAANALRELNQEKGYDIAEGGAYSA
ncbi:MarR family transcriptional regulator [Rhodococcus spongiicola]|uniref:MarR family transcriptional regulator n=2 Tax=Rhodococcus spongiicola TaxID=2487352 RepID=A0A438B5F3_9NOCA|nr:MarR family transcriptional regulator [Rhodococcus spongiicola]RVW06201.1 MarR family transcriptional regulator [Rhodococcus spongiicola]